MQNQKPVPQHEINFTDPVGQQASHHVEAIRRMSNGQPPDPATGLQGFDSWSSGGNLPGTMTPDVVNPETVGFGVTEVPTLAPQDRPQNFEDIVRNPMGQKR